MDLGRYMFWVLFMVVCSRTGFCVFFFFQAEDGIRDAQESRGLGDVYKRQMIALLLGSMLPWVHWSGLMKLFWILR